MPSALLALLDVDPDTQELKNARDDAHLRAELITQLVRRRKHLGLTQKSLAKRLGTTQSAVSDMERIGANPTMMTLQRYARGVDAELRAVIRAKGYVYHASEGWQQMTTFSTPVRKASGASLPSWGADEVQGVKIA